MKKRVGAWLLTAALMVGMLPTAWADDLELTLDDGAAAIQPEEQQAEQAADELIVDEPMEGELPEDEAEQELESELAVEQSQDMETVEAAGLNVAGHTASEIQAYVNNHPGYLNTPVTYQKSPSLKSPYAAGVLSKKTLTSALNLINQCRYIAGLDEVTLNTDYSAAASAGTLLNALNGQLSHYPSRPSVLSGSSYDALYELGTIGAGSSNIAYGFENVNSALIGGWMSDSDYSNISAIGHRRWVLNPEMAQTGFGETQDYYAMYVFDFDGTGTQSCVAWPAQNMPTQYFDPSDAWSVSVGETLDPSAVRVTLTRTSDNKKWTFRSGSSDGSFYVNNDYYGQPGCIIFRPSSLNKISAGNTFKVSVTGLPDGKSLAYTVRFFDLKESSIVCSHSYKTTIKAATPTADGKITKECTKCGYKPAATKIYKASKISLSKTSYPYDGKVKKPAVTVKDSKGNTIGSGNYSISYASGRKTVGSYKVTVKFKGSKYSGSVTKSFKINPKGTSLKSVTAASKGFTAKWTKQATQTTGYEIQYATNSKFTSAKTVTISKNKTVSKKITKLTAKKKYYVRIRTYKTVSGTKYVSSWSKAKTVTTKK